MKYVIFLLCLWLGMSWSNAQNLSVPEEMLEELETVEVIDGEDTLLFRVAFPQQYNASKTYPVLLGLSGGDQSEKIVNYCYAAWFRSGYFKDYITLLPVNRNKKNFNDYTPEEIERFLDIIANYFPVKERWVIAGTSNGGTAAYQFIAARPEQFEGGIIAPGALSETIEPDETWSHLNLIVAYGKLDDNSWIKASKSAVKRLKPVVAAVQLVALKDQGHILPISFNVDKMFDPYFIKP